MSGRWSLVFWLIGGLPLKDQQTVSNFLGQLTCRLDFSSCISFLVVDLPILDRCYPKNNETSFTKMLGSHQSTGLERSKIHRQIENQKLYRTNSSLHGEGNPKARKEHIFHFLVTDSEVEIVNISRPRAGHEIFQTAKERSQRILHLIISGSLDCFSGNVRKMDFTEIE